MGIENWQWVEASSHWGRAKPCFNSPGREKDLSGVAVVAGLTSKNSRILAALGRRHSSPLRRDSTLSSMSRKQSGFDSLNMFEVCRLLLLKIDWYWFLYHNLPRGKRFLWMHLQIRWFDDKGFHIFVGHKTWLLESFTNRRNKTSK